MCDGGFFSYGLSGGVLVIFECCDGLVPRIKERSKEYVSRV